jgi:signal peptidase I
LTAPPPAPYQVPPAAPPPPPVAAEARRERSRLTSALIEIVTTVGLAVILYLVIQTFVVQTFRVEQGSMLSTLRPDEHLLIDKLTPRVDDYSRGDIIVFHPGGATERTPFIKRVIGVAGETVEIREGQVWIDGVPLDEPYVYRDTRTGEPEPTEPTTRRSEWVVPPDSLFVLGDHRQQSTDSRASSVGYVHVSHVVGRAWLRFFPVDRLGILDTPGYDLPATAAP